MHLREQGALTPGESALSGAALSRMTGYSVLTCRRALRILIAAGVLVQSAIQSARPRVPGHDHNDLTLADAKNVSPRGEFAGRCSRGQASTIRIGNRGKVLAQPLCARLANMERCTDGTY